MDPDNSTLKEKLSTLKDDLSSLTSKATLAYRPIKRDGGKASDGTRSGHDSGYVSAVSTPDTNKHIFINKPDASGLKVFDKPIPEELRDRFYDFKVQYTRSLWEAVSKRKKNAHPGDISMKLKYMGASEENSKWYIVVQCDKRVAKRVKSFFAQDHVVQDLRPDFQVHIIDTGLTRLCAEEAVEVLAQLGQKKTLCGTQVRLAANGASASATIGGTIIVKGRAGPAIFGLTASHPLAAICHDMSDRWSSSESDIDDDETDDDSSLEDGTSDVILEPNEDPVSSDQAGGHAPMASIGTIAYETLHCPSTSTYHDWALVRLCRDRYLPNLLNPECDPSDMFVQNEPLSTPAAIELFSAPNRHKTVSKQVAVLSSRGIQRGTLACNDSSLMMNPGRTFIQVFDLLPSSGSELKPGDSGSWVVNGISGEVYGHLISVDAFGEGCVVPIQDILSDIQTQLRADRVSLATSEDLFTKPGPSQVETQDADAKPSKSLLPSAAAKRPREPEYVSPVVLHPDAEECSGTTQVNTATASSLSLECDSEVDWTASLAPSRDPAPLSAPSAKNSWLVALENEAQSIRGRQYKADLERLNALSLLANLQGSIKEVVTRHRVNQTPELLTSSPEPRPAEPALKKPQADIASTQRRFKGLFSRLQPQKPHRDAATQHFVGNYPELPGETARRHHAPWMPVATLATPLFPGPQPIVSQQVIPTVPTPPLVYAQYPTYPRYSPGSPYAEYKSTDSGYASINPSPANSPQSIDTTAVMKQDAVPYTTAPVTLPAAYSSEQQEADVQSSGWGKIK